MPFRDFFDGLKRAGTGHVGACGPLKSRYNSSVGAVSRQATNIKADGLQAAS